MNDARKEISVQMKLLLDKHRGTPGVLGGFQWSSLHDVRMECSGQVVGCLPVECLAWSMVEFVGNSHELGGAVDAQVGAFREVVAEEPVRVSLVGRCHGLPR